MQAAQKSPIWTRKYADGTCACGSAKPARICCYDTTKKVWYKKPAVISVPNSAKHSHPKCIFSHRNECNEKISREHYFSKAILKQFGNLTISGFDWLNGQTRNISIKSMASNILCENHNNILSPLDKSAAIFFEAMLNMGRPSEVAENKHDLYVVSGIDIERWLLKAFCGALGAKALIDAEKNKRGIQDIKAEWLDMIINPTLWDPPQGMYIRGELNEKIPLSNSLGMACATAIDDPEVVGGAMFQIAGFEIALVLHDTMSTKHEQWHYRISNFIHKDNKKRRAIIFTW